MPVSEQASIVMMLLGMAVGVDYSMFYLKREREERARARGALAALEAAAATSGRAVLISGFTVMIATAGMYLSGDADSFSFATGSILVVGVAVLGSLTVLPAVLVKLGHRVHKSRAAAALPPRQGQGRLPRLGLDPRRRCCAAPSWPIVVAGGVLLALAAPALHMKTMVTGADDLSRSDFPVMKTYDKVTAAFPSEANGVEIVVKADRRDLARRCGRDRRAADAGRRDQAVTGPTRDARQRRPAPSPASSCPLVGNGTDEQSMDAPGGRPRHPRARHRGRCLRRRPPTSPAARR